MFRRKYEDAREGGDEVVGMTMVKCNAMKSKIMRILEAGNRLVGRETRSIVGMGCILSLESFPNSPMRRVLARSFRAVMGSTRMSVIIRAVKNMRPTCAFMGHYLRTNGGITASGGTLMTGRKTRLLRVTHGEDVGFVFRTDINKNVPVVHTLGSSLATSEVSRIAKVLGKAAGCVLAGVFFRDTSCSRILGRTRRGKCTRHGPRTSIRKRSTYEGVTVLASLVTKRRISFRAVRARKVAGVAARSVGCTGGVSVTVGLLTSDGERKSSFSTVITPVLLSGGRPLYGIGSMFGTIFIHKGVLNSTVFCKDKTNGLPATDTMITSIMSTTGRLREAIMAE